MGIDSVFQIEYSIWNMKPMHTLRLLALSNLQQQPTQNLTRYDLMTKINHAYSLLDSPYSPGAVYHEIKKLSSEKLIKIDPSGAQILPAGLQAFHTEITQGVLPKALTPLLARCFAIHSVAEARIREIGLKRLSIELINNNHISTDFEHGSDSSYLPIDFWRQFIGESSKKLILGFVAKI